MIEKDAADSPLDVFLWIDGYWCFRDEFSESFAPAAMPHRVIKPTDPEWYLCTRDNKHLHVPKR
jgi:hypothetical protein